MMYFVALGAAERVGDWQILTPVRSRAHGVIELNRVIQRRFRERTRDRAMQRWRKIPKPAGPEEILYGDKVISTRNDTRRRVFPREDAEHYVANGDIGVVVGQFKGRRWRGRGLPWLLKVEYGSQPGYTYDYSVGAFGDDRSPPLELAYALTVHRAQGSEFTDTIVVIPDPCRQLSRELLYTALTRQRERVTVLYQGDSDALKRYASPERSETARRLTNLFEPPDPLPIQDGFLERGLLHATSDSRVVRSRSELTIAECLARRGVRWDYERKLAFSDGSFRYPTFTVEDDDAGIVVYWEHLTLLEDSQYAHRWQRKRAWYHAHEVRESTPDRPQGGAAGLLVWTADDASGAVDPTVVDALAGRLFD
jgi:hypothetical protein